jgi:thioredoxin reductase
MDSFAESSNTLPELVERGYRAAEGLGELMVSTKQLPIAVVGAGPYGLSIAAHLRARGVEHRIFGSALQTWRSAMPKGMRLKSDGFASNLSAPSPNSTLGHYCLTHGLPYHPTDIPIPLQTFIDYGLEFQGRFVPHLEPKLIASIVPLGSGYQLTLDDGEEFQARNVVVAAGITHFASMPDIFGDLPVTLASHSSAHRDLSCFAGRDVTVVGAGSSAVELAISLASAGAQARLICRAPSVKFASAPDGKPRNLVRRLRHPQSGLGPGIRSQLCCEFPEFFRFLPIRARAQIVRRHLGPSSPWYLRGPFESDVEILTSRTIRQVAPINSHVSLKITGETNGAVDIDTDHVICATGYRPAISRLNFLNAEIRKSLRTVNDAPVLNTEFESSLPGLYFTGIAAAMSFGPLLRFMYGTEFAAPRLARHLAKSAT